MEKELINNIKRVRFDFIPDIKGKRKCKVCKSNALRLVAHRHYEGDNNKDFDILIG